MWGLLANGLRWCRVLVTVANLPVMEIANSYRVFNLVCYLEVLDLLVLRLGAIGIAWPWPINQCHYIIISKPGRKIKI